MHQARRYSGSAFALLFAVAVAGGCNSDGPGNGVTCTAPGGPAVGAQDDHCTVNGAPVVQPTSLGACTPGAAGAPAAGGADAATGGAEAAGGAAGAPTTGAGGAAAPEFGAPMYGVEADDDDCKYHVSWSVTPICENGDTTFTVLLTNKVDGSAVAGANLRVDVFLTDTHIAPNAGRHTTESPDGTYTVGPVRFDQKGLWTVRFHFFENCSDESEESPHGHAAFFLDVP
jgi:hypothetical protein